MSDKGLTVKKAFSSLDLAVSLSELRVKVLNSYIDNIYTDIAGSLIVKLRNQLETNYLLLKPAERIHMTKNVSKLESAGRTTLFRRFLNNLKVCDVKQVEFERIAVVELEGRGRTYSLYVELIPRGLIALVDEGGKVLVTSKGLKVRDREVVVGKPYTPPPTYKDFRTLETRDWVEILSKYDSLTRGLVRGLGIPPEVVNEVLSDGPRDITPGSSVAEIKDKLTHFVNKVIEKPEPVIIARNDGKYVSFLPFRPSKLPQELNVIPFENFNEAVDEYFLKLTAGELVTGDSKALVDELSRIDKLADDLRNELANLTVRLKELKNLHDLVASNYNVLEEVSDCVKTVIKRYGWEQVKVCGISDYDRSKGIVKVRVGDTDIELNIRERVNDYLIRLKTQIGECEDKIEKVKEVLAEALKKKSVLMLEKEALSSPPLIKRVDWYDKYHWIITSEGYLAIGGRDSGQNEKLVRKYLSDDDIFVHADITGAPAFILKVGGKHPSESSLTEVATLAASYSRGWKEGFAALDVFWVYGHQVSKKPPAGEYLTPGSFMIYGEKNYLNDVKLELALGVLIMDDKYYKLVAGPEDYVRSRCSYYAVIRPGSERKESVAKKIVDSFKKSDPRLRYVDLNDLILRIPGPSRIDKVVTSPHN